MAVGAEASGYWSEIEDAMTENRSEQNLAGNVLQRDGVELHQGIHWDQLMAAAPGTVEVRATASELRDTGALPRVAAPGP